MSRTRMINYCKWKRTESTEHAQNTTTGWGKMKIHLWASTTSLQQNF